MENVLKRNIFQLAGATFNNVIKATVFLSDINDFTAVNEIYQVYFTENYPARAAIQVTGLSKNLLGLSSPGGSSA